jgi:hypothetical protein
MKGEAQFDQEIFKHIQSGKTVLTRYNRLFVFGNDTIEQFYIELKSYNK